MILVASSAITLPQKNMNPQNSGVQRACGRALPAPENPGASTVGRNSPLKGVSRHLGSSFYRD